MGWKPLFLNWNNKSTPIWKVLKQSNRAADKAEKFLNKLNSAKTAANNRIKLVPSKATVRREHIKCGKAFCHRRHGPYYYAYWKDANGRLRYDDMEKLLENNNKILDSLNNLDKLKLEQKKKKKKDKRILSC
jgi:hypothetical protein